MAVVTRMTTNVKIEINTGKPQPDEVPLFTDNDVLETRRILLLITLVSSIGEEL